MHQWSSAHISKKNPIESAKAYPDDDFSSAELLAWGRIRRLLVLVLNSRGLSQSPSDEAIAEAVSDFSCEALDLMRSSRLSCASSASAFWRSSRSLI